MRFDANLLPAPRWGATRWLSAPARPISTEVADQLRMSMFRRLGAVLASAPLTVGIALLAASRHPTRPFLSWLVLDIALLVLRITIVADIGRRIKRGKSDGLLGPWATDLFIAGGTVWSALLGYGAFITISSNDAGLVILVLFACTAVLAVQTIRNPSSPRMNIVQMGLILMPLSAGALLSPLPLVGWGFILWPIYLLAMGNLSRQMHDDYVALIVAQIDNRHRAQHCGLTGLPNRSFFDESLSRALRETTPTQKPLALLFVDLDGFKLVNDQFGHPLGDALLIQVSARLRSLVSGKDMVARLGGDEFAILMRSSDRAGVEAMASRINGGIAEPFTLQSDVAVTIGASVGVIMIDGASGSEQVDASVAIARADQALYAAKHAGKGTFRWSHDGVFAAS